MILHQYAVVEQRKGTRRSNCAIRRASGRMENDVVGLPLLRRPARVYQRCVLAIERSAGPIWVGGVMKGIQNLHFIPALQIHAAVSARLALGVRHRGSGKLYMNLCAAEFPLRINITGAAFASHHAITDGPGGGLP